MSVNAHVVEQVFAYLGLVMWSFQLAPQAYKTYRRKTTDGVSPWAMLIWSLSGAFLGNYNIGINVAVPLIVQPQLFAFIAFICLVQELYYGRHWTRWNATAAFVFLIVASGALEVGLVFAFWAADRNGNRRAIEFFGVLPVVTILIGFLPQYVKIARERRVEGVSHLFLCMDFFGSVFSCISLAFRDEIDVLTLVNYTAIALFDLGIFLLYYIFKFWNSKKTSTPASSFVTKQQKIELSPDEITTSALDGAEKGLPASDDCGSTATVHSSVADDGNPSPRKS